MKEITLRPIGFARNSEREPRFGSFADGTSQIIVDEEFTEALNSIDDYSHVVIVYWMDKVKDYVMTHRPQDIPEVPVVGIFACRCPPRPNPVGVSTVRLMGREGNKITVKGLDILDGTPVIDIKPHWPQYDKVENARIPDWVDKLDI